MQYISDTMVLERRIWAYANNPSCPDELSQRLTSIPGVQADRISQAAQILYAHFDLLGDEGKELMGLLFTYGINQNWTQWAEDNGAAAIVAIVEGGDDADAPAPKTQFRDGAVDWRGRAEGSAPGAAPASPAAPVE